MVMCGAALAAVSACSAGDATAPASQTTVSSSAALNAKTVDNDVAVSSGTAIMANLDNFAATDAFGGIAFSQNVPIVRLGDNPPTTTTTSGTTTGTTTTSTSGTPTVEKTDDKPAGSLPTVPPSGVPCRTDSNEHLQCAFGNSSSTVSSTVTFVDNKGVVTQGFKAGVTDTVRTTLVASRHVTSADSMFTAAYRMSSSRAVGGFLNPQGDRTTNGVGTGADTSAFVSKGVSRTYAGTSADTIKALVYAEHRSLNPYPKGGTMIHVVQSVATANDGKGKIETVTVNRRVVVTYDGTATAKLQIGATTCQLHLDTRKVDNCS
jgi:hypothetical protein